MITEISQRDVVFTPFMLRVRDAVNGNVSAGSSQMPVELSETCSIAVAVDEWVGLRTYGEHMIAEANAMLDPGSERIELLDECGAGVLAFQILWKGRGYRLFIDQSADGHRGRIEAGDEDHPISEKPADLRALDDLIIDMLSRPTTARMRK
jgi:hypothetical protein